VNLHQGLVTNSVGNFVGKNLSQITKIDKSKRPQKEPYEVDHRAGVAKLVLDVFDIFP